MAGDGQPFLVQAVYSFKGKNNDEVSDITFINMIAIIYHV